MKNTLLILLAVAVGVAIAGGGMAALSPFVGAIGVAFGWVKTQLANPFAQGVAVGAAGVLVLQTLTRGRR